MSKENTHQKKQYILEHESALAHQLAGLILDKPKPPIWMIFVPVFFVFFVQKMNQYKNGLKDFVENYLISRRRALEAALEAEETGISTDMKALAESMENVPVQARPLYAEWMEVLIDHYRQLLSSQGNSHAALVRSGYRNKTNFLLFCNSLNKAEKAYSMALLPELDGDNKDIAHVIEKIDVCVTDIRRRDADKIFP
ncbi:NF038143 family protein [Desulfoprunum benzoelyticum]|uniref:NF038143 family protein n=1 Tax=Desulfoprunum benzoelyticum TaxID=1506996 RepID=UPI0019645AE8|nr:NF038143 family protein [Desulfoprunum benzoelyticum]MBM9531962.1 NF038143 family protein [Desulfoprunum benzoelyticum]